MPQTLQIPGRDLAITKTAQQTLELLQARPEGWGLPSPFPRPYDIAFPPTSAGLTRS